MINSISSTTDHGLLIIHHQPGLYSLGYNLGYEGVVQKELFVMLNEVKHLPFLERETLLKLRVTGF